MKRKYRVASSAIVLMISGSLRPALLDRIVKKIVNVKAKKSKA